MTETNSTTQAKAGLSVEEVARMLDIDVRYVEQVAYVKHSDGIVTPIVGQGGEFDPARVRAFLDCAITPNWGQVLAPLNEKKCEGEVPFRWMNYTPGEGTDFFLLHGQDPFSGQRRTANMHRSCRGHYIPPEQRSKVS